MRRDRHGGFTLIEVLVVVFLVALLLSSVMVNLDGRLPSTRTESAARSLLSTLDLARTSALSYGRDYDVLLDFEEQRYTIRLPFDEDGNPVADPSRREVLPWTPLDDGVLLLSMADATGKLVDRDIQVVTFRPAGSGREVWIHLGNSADDSFALTVRLLALTGVASVMQGLEMPEELTDDDF